MSARQVIGENVSNTVKNGPILSMTCLKDILSLKNKLYYRNQSWLYVQSFSGNFAAQNRGQPNYECIWKWPEKTYMSRSYLRRSAAAFCVLTISTRFGSEFDRLNPEPVFVLVSCSWLWHGVCWRLVGWGGVLWDVLELNERLLALVVCCAT